MVELMCIHMGFSDYIMFYRAAAYSKLHKHVKAIEDCEKALVIDPQYSKAYGRMGFVHCSY